MKLTNDILYKLMQQSQSVLNWEYEADSYDVSIGSSLPTVKKILKKERKKLKKLLVSICEENK